MVGQVINKEENPMKKTALMTFVLVFALSGISMARGPGYGRENIMPRGKWWKSPEVAERLRLTPDEKEKLDTQYLEHRQQMIDLRAQVAKERLELEQLFDSTKFDSAACMDSFKKLEKAHVNLATERFKFLVQVREMLGLERFQELKAEFWKHLRQRREGGRFFRRGGPPAE
jgi:Spy/CpxP family protein refolding chaperone